MNFNKDKFEEGKSYYIDVIVKMEPEPKKTFQMRSKGIKLCAGLLFLVFICAILAEETNDASQDPSSKKEGESEDNGKEANPKTDIQKPETNNKESEKEEDATNVDKASSDKSDSDPVNNLKKGYILTKPGEELKPEKIEESYEIQTRAKKLPIGKKFKKIWRVLINSDKLPPPSSEDEKIKDGNVEKKIKGDKEPEASEDSKKDPNMESEKNKEEEPKKEEETKT